MARRRVPPNTVCYLCGRAITDADSWNRDHHPPKRFFGRSVRPGVNMRTLYTHKACNTSFKHDEEYFVAAMPVQAMGAWTADAVFGYRFTRSSTGSTA